MLGLILAYSLYWTPLTPSADPGNCGPEKVRFERSQMQSCNCDYDSGWCNAIYCEDDLVKTEYFCMEKEPTIEPEIQGTPVEDVVICEGTACKPITNDDIQAVED